MFYGFATNATEGVCAKDCHPLDGPCQREKREAKCGGSWFDFATGKPKPGSDERLQEDGFATPDTDPITGDLRGFNKRGGNQKSNCSKDCGSYFNPMEWGCYFAKMTGGCGGSTGLCDTFGAGEACTKYGKYALIIGGGIVAVILLKQFKVI